MYVSNDDFFVPELWFLGNMARPRIIYHVTIHVHSQTTMIPVYLCMFSFSSAPASVGQLPPEGHPFNPTVVSATIIISVEKLFIIQKLRQSVGFYIMVDVILHCRMLLFLFCCCCCCCCCSLLSPLPCLHLSALLPPPSLPSLSSLIPSPLSSPGEHLSPGHDWSASNSSTTGSLSSAAHAGQAIL